MGVTAAGAIGTGVEVTIGVTAGVGASVGTGVTAAVVIGTLVGVGAWPYDHSSPYGALWKWFANNSSLGLALRNVR